ncbi:ankyrin repeat and BTB/POZ domain-containing protein 2-like [Lineus longissimus]|uniref:ankyrin repeat and BTB/POZ domain-containing protein 2-like n=1 Tax=Lineus longissimus TaxID=88925 RepID=UPI00315DD6AD
MTFAMKHAEIPPLSERFQTTFKSLAMTDPDALRSGSSNSASTNSASTASTSPNDYHELHCYGYISDVISDVSTPPTKVCKVNTSTPRNFMQQPVDLNNTGTKRLPDLNRVPWSLSDLTKALHNGRTKHLKARIAPPLVNRLGYLMQRPLVRLAREAQRLSHQYNKCTKHEIKSSVRIILSNELAESCTNACFKAATLFGLSGNSVKESWSKRCGLSLNVGKFHRWMIEAQVALYVEHYASIWLCACVENLLEELVLMTLGHDLAESIPGIEAVDFGITLYPELWGLFQPYEHLICGRLPSGTLALPKGETLTRTGSIGEGHSKGHTLTRKHGKVKVDQTTEQMLLATCVGSVAELGRLVKESMQHLSEISTSQKQDLIMWSPESIHTLYYYLQCPELIQSSNPTKAPAGVNLVAERPYPLLPPLVEWLRVTVAFSNYHQRKVVDPRDVIQAARVILPGYDCPPPYQRLPLPGMEFKLANGKKTGFNAVDDEGLTPLMHACLRGDEDTAMLLSDLGVNCDVQIPLEQHVYPDIHPGVRGWTALTCATAHGHMAIVESLLSYGANVDGCPGSGDGNNVDTPLQVAAAIGHGPIVSLLLSKGADPYLQTVSSNRITSNNARVPYTAFSLAASHGNKDIIQQLLSQPILPKSTDILSLEEILAESSMSDQCKPYAVTDITCTYETPRIFDDDHTYVSIEELTSMDRSMRSKMSYQPMMPPNLTKLQGKALHEAFYCSAQNGHLDITLELRSAGVPWTMHTWYQSVMAAHALTRKAILHCLLKDFNLIPEDPSEEFLDECLPLLFTIFRKSKNEAASHLLASIFSQLLSKQPMPAIAELNQRVAAGIDSTYVNNPSMADVQFVIEGRLFYAHKIILVSASAKFKTILANSSQLTEGSLPCIEIKDMKYKTFEMVMQFLYKGNEIHPETDPLELLELLAAANFFQLDALHRHCEVLCAQRMNYMNCLTIFRHAKLLQATALENYCQTYFIKEFPDLLKVNASFKKTVFSARQTSAEFVDLICKKIASILRDSLEAKRKK